MKKTPKNEKKKYSAIANASANVSAASTVVQQAKTSDGLYIFAEGTKVLYVCSQSEMQEAPLRVTDHWVFDDTLYLIKAMPQFMVSNLDKGSVVPRIAAYMAWRLVNNHAQATKNANVEAFMRQLMLMLPVNNTNPRKAVLVMVNTVDQLAIDPLLLDLDGALSNGFCLNSNKLAPR